KYAACETAYVGVKPVFEKFVDAVAPVKGSMPDVDTSAPETFLAGVSPVFKHVARAYNAVRMNIRATQDYNARLEVENKALEVGNQKLELKNEQLKVDCAATVAELAAAEKVLEVEAKAKDALLADKAQLESDYDAKSNDFNAVRAAFVAEAKAKDVSLVEKKALEDKYAVLVKAKDAQRLAYDAKHKEWMAAESKVRDLNDDVAKKTSAMSAVSAERDVLQSGVDNAVSVLNGLLGELDGIDKFFKTTAQGLHDKLAAYS
ncbi:hypothetical protein HY485_00315, partial [Candidatus Woesearchaeota archaeon]|nr:hypothetical protein [Candidatus Woesearchaeota archaeon]